MSLFRTLFSCHRSPSSPSAKKKTKPETKAAAPPRKKTTTPPHSQHNPNRYANCYSCRTKRQLRNFLYSEKVELAGGEQGEYTYYRYRCVSPSEGPCAGRRYSHSQQGSRGTTTRLTTSPVSHAVGKGSGVHVMPSKERGVSGEFPSLSREGALVNKKMERLDREREISLRHLDAARWLVDEEESEKKRQGRGARMGMGSG